MLKTAVANLINFQNDAEVALRAIPELIKLLGDKDEVLFSLLPNPSSFLVVLFEFQVVRGQAAAMVHQLTKRESARQALVQTPDPGEPLVKALCDAMEKTVNQVVLIISVFATFNILKFIQDTQKDALGALCEMSHNPEGLLAIFRSGGIPALIRMLK